MTSKQPRGTSMTKELTVQPTLDPEVFGRFINLSVGVSLSGSATYDMAELEKVMGGEKLQKGSELVITARYFVADMTMPVSRETSYDRNYESKYKLGNAKLALKLIKVESIDVKEAKLHQCSAQKCECLVNKDDCVGEDAGIYTVAKYPLQGFFALRGCPECHGQGYVFQRENKAPLARRVYANGVVILVDELPEPPDIPEGACPQCGQKGYHMQECPVKAEQEAAQKAAAKAAKKAYKEQTGNNPPPCYGTWEHWKANCRSCEATNLCSQGEAEKAAARAADDKPECFGDGTEDDAECEECDFQDECSAIVDPESCIESESGQDTEE